jgi:hypothetical protein
VCASVRACVGKMVKVGVLTLSDPMSDLVQHYDFLFPTLFLIFNPFQSNFSATRILPSSYLFRAGKGLVGYL